MGDQTKMDISENPGAITLTADIVQAFVANNVIPASELPNIIGSVHRALITLGTSAPEPAARPEPLMPIKKTITPDYIVSLEDGKRYKSLKRHLAGRGLTPEQYREKWGLPVDYPMVAPSYAAQRSALAKAAGLGRKPAPEPEPEPVAPKKKSGGSKKPKAAAPAPAASDGAPDIGEEGSGTEDLVG